MNSWALGCQVVLACLALPKKLATALASREDWQHQTPLPLHSSRLAQPQADFSNGYFSLSTSPLLARDLSTPAALTPHIFSCAHAMPEARLAPRTSRRSSTSPPQSSSTRASTVTPVSSCVCRDRVMRHCHVAIYALVHARPVAPAPSARVQQRRSPGWTDKFYVPWEGDGSAFVAVESPCNVDGTVCAAPGDVRCHGRSLSHRYHEIGFLRGARDGDYRQGCVGWRTMSSHDFIRVGKALAKSGDASTL